jgi:hypothetical protein
VVRVLIAPPISRRTAEISRGCPKYPRIGAFPPVRLGLWILALCLDGRVKELKQDHHCHDYHPKLDVYIQGKIINQPLPHLAASQSEDGSSPAFKVRTSVPISFGLAVVVILPSDVVMQNT